MRLRIGFLGVIFCLTSIAFGGEPTAHRTLSFEDRVAARTNHTAVWTGTEMIVWGGVLPPSGSNATNTGGRYNPAQTDSNHNGAGDVCDLNDGLIYVLGTDSKDYVEWQQESGPTSWNVYEGDLSVLRGTGVYTQAPGSNPLADRQCGVVDVFVEDLVVPPSGAVRFSLVTGVTTGFEGSLGADSGGTPRANTNPCP